MAKQLVFEEDLREALKNGVEKIGRAVRTTLGPKGHTVVLDRSFGAPKVTKNGITVAEEVKLVDPNENMAAQVMKAAASKTSKDVGDGTTTTLVLAEAMFNQGLRHVTAGASPVAIFRGMQKANELVAAALEKQATPLTDDAKIRRVATVACHGDEEIGALIADTLKKIGGEGVFTVEEGKSAASEIEFVAGMTFDRGYIASQFVNDQDAGKCVLDNPYILLLEDKLSTAKELLPLLEQIMDSGRPLLIVAEDVDGEALATLVLNQVNGILKVCAVKAPGYGDRRKQIMGDLAAVVKTRFFSKDLGIQLRDLKPEDLGSSKKVIVDKENTTVVDGAGSKDAINERITQIRKAMDLTTSDYDREKLQERLAKFAGGVAKFLVGAPSETELREKKARVESAVKTTRNAIESGILPGGGLALARAAAALDKADFGSDDENTGRDILRDALPAPLKLIADNAGIKGGPAWHKIQTQSNPNWGLNVQTGEFGDLLKDGVLDALKVVKTALGNAVSAAGILLTTEAAIATKKEKKSENAGHGHAGHSHAGHMH